MTIQNKDDYRKFRERIYAASAYSAHSVMSKKYGNQYSILSIEDLSSNSDACTAESSIGFFGWVLIIFVMYVLIFR